MVYCLPRWYALVLHSNSRAYQSEATTNIEHRALAPLLNSRASGPTTAWMFSNCLAPIVTWSRHLVYLFFGKVESDWLIGQSTSLLSVNIPKKNSSAIFLNDRFTHRAHTTFETMQTGIPGHSCHGCEWQHSTGSIHHAASTCDCRETRFCT